LRTLLLSVINFHNSDDVGLYRSADFVFLCADLSVRILSILWVNIEQSIMRNLNNHMQI